MKLTVGVDPGLSGAIAILDVDGSLVEILDMPSTDGHVLGSVLFDALSEMPRSAIAWIEDVHSMPNQGVASTFKFGRAVGVCAGVIGACGIPINWVAPTRWKRALGLTKDKAVCRRRAQELWPDKADLFRRVRDDGRAEAALIAHYGRSQSRLNGGE